MINQQTADAKCPDVVAFWPWDRPVNEMNQPRNTPLNHGDGYIRRHYAMLACATSEIK